MSNSQRGGSTIVGIIIGIVLGLAAALAVAVYVTKVPVPFTNKGNSRTPEQDAAESRKNQNWDPNAPLYGKNPAKPQAPASSPAAAADPAAAAKASTETAKAAPAAPAQPAPAQPAATQPAPTPAAAASVAAKPATKAPAAPAASADPLGDLAAMRAGNAAAGDPFIYFVQAGAFRTAEDAEAQRAKLSLMGLQAKVTEREQSGRQVFRVRVGPFDNKDEADNSKERLEAGGFEAALVRVQR